MSANDEFDLTDEDQTVLACWRQLIEREYFDDIQRLSHYSEEVFGLEVEHAHLTDDDDLKAMFHERPFHCLKLGTMVLNEQFGKAGVHMRGTLRVVRLSDEYRTSINELRMRNRNTIVAVDVNVVSTSDPYGWLKLAKYRCRDCKDEVEIPQRRARERESPRFCSSCLKSAREEGDEEAFRLFAMMHTPNFAMVMEECYYEDAQTLVVQGVSSTSDGTVLRPAGVATHMAIVSDELVGAMEVSTYYRLNGLVKVEPLPDRNFVKDTRRMLVVDVFSAEQLPFRD